MAAKFSIVTGGSRGIGYEVCKKLLQKGKPVILASRDKARGLEATQKLSELGEVRFMELDAANKRSVASFAQHVAEKYPDGIDVLVNNAGVAHKGWSKEDFDANVATNTLGPLELTQALLPAFSPGAAVVMVSSSGGQRKMISDDYWEAIDSCESVPELMSEVQFRADSPMAKSPITPAYLVSKAMLNKAIRLMAEQEPQLKQQGINIVAVCPGWCSTDMGGQMAPRTPEQGAQSVMWAVLNASPDIHGKFFKDGEPLDW